MIDDLSSTVIRAVIFQQYVPVNRVKYTKNKAYHVCVLVFVPDLLSPDLQVS